MIRKDIREFSKNEIASRLQEIEEKGAIPNEIIKAMGEINLLCMSVDEKYGGINADPVTVGIVAEELARADISCAIPTFFLVEASWEVFLIDMEPKRPNRRYCPMHQKVMPSWG